jgi:hypothetical protein
MHRLALELTVVQLLDGGRQVGHGLVLDEAGKLVLKAKVKYPPSAVALAADLGVDDVQARLARKVFQVLIQ